MGIDSEETYTNEQALQKSLEWCEQHPGWKRMCDIEDTDGLYKTWEELSEKEKKPWVKEYRSSAEDAWGEFGRRPCKVPFGFVTGKGEFYKSISQVPLMHNLMTVYKVE